ncbi:MAG TPA: hypothetical protein VKD69_00140 [Vicinamibacterales bacterium]|nr:hypothetical protein [Vicinamibacterales bacterium]
MNPAVAPAAAAFVVQRLDGSHAAPAAALLAELRVSLFGIHSRRLYDALVADSVGGKIDGRIAAASGEVCGVVLAAPRGYWTSAPLTHWRLGLECARARLFGGPPFHAAHSSSAAAKPSTPRVAYDDGPPRRMWDEPGDAWRIIIVGTAASARGRGVAAELYRAVMRDRSLVARIAADNHASLRLHRSVGWRLYPDGDVVLAVHERQSVT